MIVLAIVNLPVALGRLDLRREPPARRGHPAVLVRRRSPRLDAGSHDTRVLEIPGADFAAYRWGETVDPITPGLMDRPYVARELVPWGSPASADLLNALDRRLQEGVLDPAAIAPIARLMSVGDVLYRADLQTDRFDLPRAAPAWALLTSPSRPGLGHAEGVRRRASGRRCAYSQDRRARARAAAGRGRAAAGVSVFPVDGAPSIVRTESAVVAAHRVGRRRGPRRPRGPRRARRRQRRALLRHRSRATSPALRRQIASRDVGARRHRLQPQARPALGTRSRDVEGADRAGRRDRVDDRRRATPGSTLFPDAGPDAQTVVQTPDVAVSTTQLREPRSRTGRRCAARARSTAT